MWLEFAIPSHINIAYFRNLFNSKATHVETLSGKSNLRCNHIFLFSIMTLKQKNKKNKSKNGFKQIIFRNW